MQRDKNLVYINNVVNGQQIDAIHMGYRQTGAVYTRRSGSVQIHPDRPPISVRARIGSNSNLDTSADAVSHATTAELDYHQLLKETRHVSSPIITTGARTDWVSPDDIKLLNRSSPFFADHC